MNESGKITILICDDAPEIREMIGIYMKNEGYGISFAANGREAVDQIREGGIDLLILDVMMPVMDGIRACLTIREENSLPILFLTARTEDTDKILGLSSGGDDYLSKPFNPLELTARVKALLRRRMTYDAPTPTGTPDGVLEIGGLRILTDSFQVFLEGDEIRLTRTEFAILRLLAENRGVLFSIDRLLDVVWGDVAVSRNTAMVHIRKLREKLRDDPKDPQYIKTVWGMGYKME